MEKFNFNLQRVLDFKAGIEEKKKEAFVIALKDCIEQEKRLNELIKNKNHVIENNRAFKTPLDFQTHYRYIEYINKQIEQETEELKLLNSIKDEKMAELIKSTSDRKVLEMLKEKAFDEFNAEQNKREQKENDDFALYSYIRAERR